MRRKCEVAGAARGAATSGLSVREKQAEGELHFARALTLLLAASMPFYEHMSTYVHFVYSSRRMGRGAFRWAPLDSVMMRAYSNGPLKSRSLRRKHECYGRSHARILSIVHRPDHRYSPVVQLRTNQGQA
jgi:hypothetical protein